jgi:hypothetical protein
MWLDFEAPIAGWLTAEADELGDKFRSALPSQDSEQSTEGAAVRVLSMLSAVVGMHFRPEQRNEPFGATVAFAAVDALMPKQKMGKPRPVW